MMRVKLKTFTEFLNESSQRELSSSFPAGNMVITTYYEWAPYNEKGQIVVTITKGDQYGGLVDSKQFEFVSNGDYAGANRSNPSFNKARREADVYGIEQSNLWYNKAEYDKLSPDEIEKLRSEGNVFWQDDKILKQKYKGTKSTLGESNINLPEKIYTIKWPSLYKSLSDVKYDIGESGISDYVLATFINGDTEHPRYVSLIQNKSFFNKILHKLKNYWEGEDLSGKMLPILESETLLHENFLKTSDFIYSMSDFEKMKDSDTRILNAYDQQYAVKKHYGKWIVYDEFEAVPKIYSDIKQLRIDFASELI